jgi:hypothetical protein
MSEGNNFILTDIDSHAMYINDYDSLFTQKYNPDVRIQDDHFIYGEVFWFYIDYAAYVSSNW